MKPTVSVLVIQPFEWKGQAYTPGQAIALTPLEAIALAKKRQISLTLRRPKPEPPPVPETLTKRRYRRKDLQAEETAVMEPQK